MRIEAMAGPRPATNHPLLIIERILRDREGVWRQIKAEQGLGALINHMLISSTLALACYGAVMGFSKEPLQALSSAVKLPLLFLLTLAICLPTLYLFNLIFGARLSVRQALALVLMAVTVTSALTLAFAPISLFFLLTAQNYSFFKILNVSILTLTGCVGLSFLTGGVRSLNGSPVAPAEPAEPEETDAPEMEVVSASAGRRVVARRPAETPQVSSGLLRVWILLYGFVGTQLAWTLRPFFGDPHAPFMLFRQLESNFYVNMAKTIMHMFN